MNDPRISQIEDVMLAIESGKTEKFELALESLVTMDGSVNDKLLPFAKLLSTQAKFEESDVILQFLITTVAPSWATLETYIMNSHNRRDWPEVLRRCEEAQRLLPDDARPLVRHAITCMITEKYESAEEILTSAMVHFAEDEEVALEYARIPLLQGNLRQAVLRLSAVVQKFPAHVRALASTVETLRLLGEFKEAEEFLESARPHFEGNFHFEFQSAWNAVRLSQWQKAFDRWDSLITLHPTADIDMALGETIALWHLAKLEGDSEAIAVRLPDQIGRKVVDSSYSESSSDSLPEFNRDLIMRFESLGDNCEFGLVQRHFGAEPIGLLRWSSGIKAAQLADAIACKFEGVGRSENAFIQLHSVSKEYFSGDRRYFQMHTFIKQNEHEEVALFAKMCRRMDYLRSKLVTDLERGEKIFVYKPDKINLTEDEAIHLATTISETFPAARMMLMYSTENVSEIGKVETVNQNVVRGFVSKFAVNLDRRFIRFDEWRAVCLAAIRHFYN